MGWLHLWAAAAAALAQPGGAAPAPSQTTAFPAAQTPAAVVTQATAPKECCSDCNGWFASGGRRPLESDHCFDNFIGPISTPVYSKDPRSLTEIRGLYVHNTFPGEEILGGGDFHAVAAQVRVALTERLTFIADKDGYLFLRPRNVVRPNDGWMNIAAGLKYESARTVNAATSGDSFVAANPAPVARIESTSRRWVRYGSTRAPRRAARASTRPIAAVKTTGANASPAMSDSLPAIS